MRKLEQGFVFLNGAALMIGLAVMSVVVGWNVAGRYLFGTSLPWADEVARYTMIWTTFLGAGLALRVGAHGAITNVQEALPARYQYIVRSMILLILFCFFAFMVWVGVDYMNRMAVQKSAALRISMWWVYAAMPVGFAFLAIHLALIAPYYLRSGQHDSDEATIG